MEDRDTYQCQYHYTKIFDKKTIQSNILTCTKVIYLTAAGLALGFVGLMSGIKQGSVCASGIAGIGAGHNIFGKTMVLAVFPELYAIIAFAATFLIAAGL